MSNVQKLTQKNLVIVGTMKYPSGMAEDSTNTCKLNGSQPEIILPDFNTPVSV